jgi:hypothetical protein
MPNLQRNLFSKIECSKQDSSSTVYNSALKELIIRRSIPQYIQNTDKKMTLNNDYCVSWTSLTFACRHQFNIH